MKRQRDGFTIIEVILFLAITGLMVAGMLVGVTLALRQQQYRDTVQSFAHFLKDQYSRVISVENDRPATSTCPISGAKNDGARGQSSCVIVGRYIASTDARTYAVYPLYALRAADGSGWRYGYADGERVNYQVGWGAQARFAGRSGALTPVMSLVLYRHPDNGSLVIQTNDVTYTNTAVTHFVEGKRPNGATYTTDEASWLTEAREFCVYENGWSVGQRLSVFLAVKAGSSEAVTTGHATERCHNATTA